MHQLSRRRYVLGTVRGPVHPNGARDSEPFIFDGWLPTNRHSKANLLDKEKTARVCTWNLISGCTKKVVATTTMDHAKPYERTVLITRCQQTSYPEMMIRGLQMRNAGETTDEIPGKASPPLLYPRPSTGGPVKMGSRCRHLMDRYNE